MSASIIKSFGAVAFTCALSSCFSVNYPQANASEMELGRTLIPPAGKSLVIAYRKSSTSLTTGRTPTGISIDGKNVGATKEGSFAAIPLTPGNHTFNENSFHAIAGKTYYFRQSARNELDTIILVPTPAPIPKLVVSSLPVSEEVGRTEIGKLKQTGMGQIEVKTF